VGSERPRGPRTGIEIDPAALRQARLAAGLSLAEVAGSDLTRQAVHLIETGKVRPSVRSLRVIAHRLGVPEWALLIPSGPMADERMVAELQKLCQKQQYGDVAQEALRLIELDGSAELTAFAHHFAGQARCVLSQPVEALPHLREAQDRFQALGNPWWVAESMDWEAMALHTLEDPAALRVARTALRGYCALEPRRPETEARMLEHLGTICYRQRDHEAGRAYYESALQVDGGVRELARIARVYHGLGMCLHGLHRFRPAAELLVKAIAMYEAEQRIAPAPMRSGLPAVENDLGLVLMAQGDLERAEELFRAALEHFAAAGIERMQSHALLSLGELRQRQGRLDDALAFVVQAIERAGAWNETQAVMSGYRQLGELYAAQGNDELADASFQRALALCADSGLAERATECLRAYERVLAGRRQSRRRTGSASA
jgi:transcriptional regulator with XRE-family HTH domain